MIPIAINRLNARLRLPSQAMFEQGRIKRIIADALDRELESAVQLAGIPQDGHLCIRDLQAVVRMSLREPDSLLAAKLGQAIARAIREALRKGSSTAVHYGSRAHALIDLAMSALSGDCDRSWAWRQVAMWRADSAIGADAAPGMVMAAIAAEAQHAIAALAHLARERSAFARMLRRATPEAWETLARAALRATGSSADTMERGLMSPLKVDPSDSMADSAAEGMARRIVRQSAIVQAATTERVSDLPAPTVRALAALAILEVEPVVMRVGGEHARAMLAAVERMIHRSNANRPPASLSKSEAETTERVREGESPRARTTASEPILRGEEGGAGRSPVQTPVPEVRRRAFTRAGGLLFLLHLVDRLGLPERIVDDRRLVRRGLRWVMHQLAAALIELEPSDPAALAFAGLLPDSAAPSSQQAPPDEVERMAIAEYRARVLDALREVLDRSGEPDAALVESVCRRRAQIAADPGWIELHLALEDVAIEIRCAGLDLDPGWVPWLGVVVRFVYA